MLEAVPIMKNEVSDKIVKLRGLDVLLDRDVAELYGIETRRVNEALRNNPEKFPEGYVITLQHTEKQELVEKFDRFKTLRNSPVEPNAFTEKGLYMLATILKSRRATETTIAIIETFTQVRELARTMETLQTVDDGGLQQKTLLQRSGELMAEIVGHNLSTETVETEIELNFAVVKIKHRIIRQQK